VPVSYTHLDVYKRQVHDAVISQIAGDSTERFMAPLRAAAEAAAGALVAGDLGRYGDAMIASNEAQACLLYTSRCV